MHNHTYKYIYIKAIDIYSYLAVIGFSSCLRTALCSIHMYTYTYIYKYIYTYTYEDTSKSLSEYDVCECINTRAHKCMLQYLLCGCGS